MLYVVLPQSAWYEVKQEGKKLAVKMSVYVSRLRADSRKQLVHPSLGTRKERPDPAQQSPGLLTSLTRSPRQSLTLKQVNAWETAADEIRNLLFSEMG